MRKRSNTVQAKNVDDYLVAAQRTFCAKQPHYKRSSKNLAKDPQPDNSTILINRDPNVQENLEVANHQAEGTANNSSDFWSSFDFDCDTGSESNTLGDDQNALRMPSLPHIDNGADTDYSEDAEADSKKSSHSILKRIMVIGLNGSGKHSLINTTFECGQKELESKSQVMDLLMKTEEDEEEINQIRYQFWLRNLHKDDVRRGSLENLVKVYYKKVSLFIFVYSVTNKDSLKLLETAIQSVLEEVPKEKFTGILLGTKCDLDQQREVSLLDGASLQEKYKLAAFSETSHEDGSLKGKILQVLQEAEANMNELHNKQACSILSTD